MHREQGGWVATGLSWQDGRPVLAASNGRREHVRVVAAGDRLGWRLGGPRRCIGVWIAGEPQRRPCPHHATVEPAGGAVQCPACQSADQGLALARDRILDDGRSYALYLAWFGPGLLKVGLTAEQRGTSRLLEQAALAFTFAARGPLPAVRRAELTVAQAGLARERIAVPAKAEHWWDPSTPERRRHDLAEIRTAAMRALQGHAVHLLPDGPVVDQVELFGLTGGAPALYHRTAGLAAGAVVSGVVRSVVGRHLFLDQPPGHPPLLLDTRQLTGWTLTAVGDAHDTPTTGLDLREQRQEGGDQGALF
ncbi:DUF2797 domain-containing protein [Peterkaempfera bronchialis]|uniref:DUF2797 domain-containing protein n=1 Tax=Peterkaempfera bronchialis TaxID=2126346 RepID=UPI003C2D6382